MDIIQRNFSVANSSHTRTVPREIHRRRQLLHDGDVGARRAFPQNSWPSMAPWVCKAQSRLLIQAATEDIVEVKNLKGIRMKPRSAEDEEKKVGPMVEYLVVSNHGSTDPWEPFTNLADN